MPTQIDLILPEDSEFSRLAQLLPLMFWAGKGDAPTRNYILDKETGMLIPATWKRCMEFAHDGEMDEAEE